MHAHIHTTMPSTAGSKHPPASVPDDQDAGTTINPQITYTAEEEKAVLRKIDLVILPFVRPMPGPMAMTVLTPSSSCASSFSYSTSTSRV